MAIQLGASAGNATASDVLSGVTFSNATQQNVAGSMSNNGSLSYGPATSSQSIPAGYTSGGSISAVTGTATAADVLSGETFASASGVGLTGSMANNGSLSYTPSTSSQTIPAGYTSGGSVAATTMVATGTLDLSSGAGSVSGLAFTPSRVIALEDGASTGVYTAVFDSAQSDTTYMFWNGSTMAANTASVTMGSGTFSLTLDSYPGTSIPYIAIS